MLDKAPNGRVTDFLEPFGEALSAGDTDEAVSLFQDDCYWRDLVSFTWNIKTMEGKDQVRDMLQSQLALVKPSNWAIAGGEDAVQTNGVIEAWLTFETDVARGRISWISPLARALMKSGPGDRVLLHAPNGTEPLDILDVRYERIPVDPFTEPAGAESAPKTIRVP